MKTSVEIAESDPTTAPAPKPRLKKSQLLREQLLSLPIESLTLHTNTRALRGLVEQFKAQSIFLAGITGPTGGAGHVANAASDILRLIRDSQPFKDATIAFAMVQFLESSDEFARADKIISPLLAAIEEAEAEEAAQRQEAYRLRQVFLDAQAAAKEKHLAATNEDPAVLAARREFEKAASALPDPSVVSIQEPVPVPTGKTRDIFSVIN